MPDLSTAFAQLVAEVHKTLAVPGTKPETSLYSHFRTFLEHAFNDLDPKAKWSIVEQANADALGVPDYRINKGRNLHGWVELKAVTGKDLSILQGHDLRQTTKFRAGLNNFVLTNGWDWRLYRDGAQVGRPVVIGGPTAFDPSTLTWSPTPAELQSLRQLLDQFASAPLIPFTTTDDAVRSLANRAVALKLALEDLGEANAGAWLAGLYADFNALLFKSGQRFTWERFVDSYVQIAVFGSLLWHLETGNNIRLTQIVGLNHNLHPLLYQCMDVLWRPAARPMALEPILQELCDTINLIPPALFLTTTSTVPYVPEPLIHAYEPFFHHYDPSSRETNGVYYTPAQIVSQITSGIEFLLKAELGQPEGVLSTDAKFLDPATGTGTFLLGLLNEVTEAAATKGWPVDQIAKDLIETRCWAFELFPGPYTIAHQRLEAALKAHGATLSTRLPIFLTDTLSAPETGTLALGQLGLAGEEIKKERERADLVKTKDEILVIFGNPPYDRILGGRNSALEPFAKRLLALVADATPADQKSNLKSTWDLFVAFWAWSLWELQSPGARQASEEIPKIDPADCHGIVAFISNRTWINGGSLSGLRHLVRAGAKSVWVLDLGGDSRGAHGAMSFAGGDKNVFNIQVGVAIVWAVFERGNTDRTVVHYKRIYGSRQGKFGDLVKPFDPIGYQVVPGSGSDSFMPVSWHNKTIESAPTLEELFSVPPQIGLQSARDKSNYSPIGTDRNEVLFLDTLQRKPVLGGRLAEWAKLPATRRAAAWSTAQTRRSGTSAPSPSSLDPNRMRRYAYRPLDYRFLYDDPAWIDWWRPDLHAQLTGVPVQCLATIPHDHGAGPAVIFVDELMDQHVFRGADGGNGVWALWQSDGGSGQLGKTSYSTTFSPVIKDWLKSIGREGKFQAAFDYILAVLSAPEYTRRFWQALEVDRLRVPLTDSVAQFDRTAALGGEVRTAWRATVQSRPPLAWTGSGGGPFGRAVWEGGGIALANNRRISGLSIEAWEFSVSGYNVLQRWFRAREHWTVTTAHLMEALRVVIAVNDLVALQPRLDAELTSLLP